MNEIKLDGYCGLYCGACDIYRLSEKGRQSEGELGTVLDFVTLEK